MPESSTPRWRSSTGSKSRFVSIALIAALIFSGCAPYGPFAFFYRRLNVDGAPPIIDDSKYVFTQVDLVSTLTDGRPPPFCLTHSKSKECLAAAYADFYEQPVPVAGIIGVDLLAFRRNDVQERLISASNE